MKESHIGHYFIVMASIVIILAGIKSASTIIIPFLLSLFIAIILSPSYNYLNKKGIPTIFSLTIVIGAFVTFLALVANLIGSSVNDFSSNISFYERQLSGIFHSFVEFGAKFGMELPEEELVSLINSKQIMTYTSIFIKSMGSLFTDGFVILLTMVFMLLESENFSNKIEFATDKQEVMGHIDEIFSKIKEYMVLKALISFVTAIIVWIALAIIGTDYAFLWAVLAFLLNFIPNIGSIIAAVPAVLLTLVQLGAVSSIIVGILYIAINVIIGSVIEPKVMGKGLGLSTLVVFLSLIFWGWLLGMVGMLLSIPLTIMVKIILDANRNTKWIAVLLGTGELPQYSNK